MKNLIKVFYSFTYSEKRETYANIFLMFVVSILEAFSIGLILPLSQLIFNDNNIFTKYLLFDDKSKNILFLALLFALLIIIKNIFFSFVYYRISVFSEKIRNKLAAFIFNKYIFFDYLEYLKLKPGETIRNLSSYPSIYQQYTFAGVILIQEILIVIFISSLLVIVNYQATIIGFSLILLIILISKLIFKKKLNNIGLILAENTAKYSSYIHFSMNCIKDIKLFQSESQFEKKFNNFFKKYSRASALNQFLNSLSRFLIEIYLTIIIAALFIYIHLFDLNIENFLPILALFAVATLRLLPSGSKIISSNNTISFLNPMVKEVLKLIDNSNLEEVKKEKLLKIKNNNLRETDNVNNKLLELKEISFQFITKNTNIETKIKNLNFEIKKNSFFGIIGKSGSGKSTLLNIICGLIDPKNGEVLYHNQNIINFKKKWLSKIGYVSQEVKLFDETILNNIVMFDDNYKDQDKINRLLKVLNLDEFVNSLPEKLETVIGSEGIELSVGQKQRIGIARALIRDPEIIILDESTNSLDKKTEKEIINFLNQIKEHKTIIFVTHDQELSKICDKAINLDKL
jgi:ATP-binding cassette, subfamily B, bacterial PglK